MHTPFAQLQIYWESILSHQFDQSDLFDFLAKFHQELPSDCLLREFGRIAYLEMDRPHLGQQPILLKNAADWKTTTRIDGILPFEIPQVRDIASVSGDLIQMVVPLGFDMPSMDAIDRIKSEIGLCLVAWLHGRHLRANYAMQVELRSQCPRSAMSAKEELCVLGYLPNSRSVTIFCSDLKGRDWLCVPEASVEHYQALRARRDAAGHLKLHGISWEES